jgi:hypothetical protein
MRGSDLKAHDSPAGETPLNPKRLSHNRHYMIRTHRRLRVDPDNSPTQRFQICLPFSISLPSAIGRMDSAIYLDHQHGFLNRKVGDVGSDRMLPPDRVSESPQLSEHLPRNIFGRISILTEFSSALNDGSPGHG